MPVKTHPITSSFSRGEWSPKLEGRIDVEGYHNSAHEITNWICLITGGLITRGGWHFVAESEDSTNECRLIPLEFSELQNYILEFGDHKIRFFTLSGQLIDGGGNPYEIESPYSSDEIWEINYAQNDQELYLVHPDHAPRKLIRNSAIDWELLEENREDGPYMDEVTETTITPSATTGGITLTATPSISDNLVKNSTFDGAWDWTFGSGWVYSALYKVAIHSSDGTAALEQNIGVASGVQYRVVFTLTNSTAGYVEPQIGGVLGTARSANGTYTQDIIATGTGNLKFLPSNNFRGRINNVYVYEVISSTEIFLDSHVGSVFRLKHATTWGRVRINTVTDSLHATATVLETLGAITPSVAYMESSWSDVNGYPRIVNFHEGRIQYASTYEQPQTIWASQTYHPDVFTPGVLSDSPYSFTLSTQRIIRWLETTRLLCIGCMSGEATAVGPSDTAMSGIDPPRIKDETSHGSAPLKPLKINRSIVFLQTAEKKLREFSYKYEDDAYSAPDLTVLAEHLFQEGIMDTAYQQEPYSVLWAVTGDGTLRGCTYSRESNIIAWFSAVTDGEVESVAVIPYSGKDQLWAVIKRTINGVDKRYIEYLDWDISLDSGLTYSGVPITAVSGLDHLAGETIRVITDGAYGGEYVVSEAGQITLTTAASEIVAGLAFAPKLVTARPEIPLPNGTSQGLKKSWKKIILRLIDSTGLTVNGEVIPARTTDDLMGSPPDPYSGDFPVESVGWGVDGRITIEQTIPMSSEIVALFGTLMVGDD